MPPYPNIYAALLEDRTDNLRSEFATHTREALVSDAEATSLRVSAWVHEQLKKAYVAGVADGFAQGVAAVEETYERR